MSLLKQKIQDWCDDVSMHLFTIECFYRMTGMFVMGGDSHRQQQLPHFLSRDIKDGIDAVIDSIENIDDEEFDIQGHRRQYLIKAVQQLLESGRTIKMVQRLDQAQEPVIKSTLTLMITDFICAHLDHCIRLSR
jgi:hypothetical protein